MQNENEKVVYKVHELRSRSIEVIGKDDDDVAGEEMKVELYQSKTVQGQLEVVEEHQESATAKMPIATLSKDSEAT